ncbi:MAG: hypothetical protein H6510_15365 [Acidobacteria bacterium]|nr:hypothetical protein [Acidobacteriota bacterium]MCB9399193.1 hypothetical protein [Acidobacteriota bacterium]
MRSLAIIILGTWLFAGQLSLDELITLAHSGASKEAIIEKIQQEGIDFDINRDTLMTMKKNGLADWLVDELVTLDSGSYAAPASDDSYPRRYSGHGAALSYYRDPWDCFYGSSWFWFSPDYWWDTFYGYYGYYGSLGYYGYLGYPYGYPGYWSYPYYRNYYSNYRYIPGNRAHRTGYRNDVPDRVVGHARTRGSDSGGKSYSGSTRTTHSTHTTTRSSSSSSSRSSGGKATSRGYKKD